MIPLIYSIEFHPEIMFVFNGTTAGHFYSLGCLPWYTQSNTQSVTFWQVYSHVVTARSVNARARCRDGRQRVSKRWLYYRAFYSSQTEGVKRWPGRESYCSSWWAKNKKRLEAFLTSWTLYNQKCGGVSTSSNHEELPDSRTASYTPEITHTL